MPAGTIVLSLMIPDPEDLGSGETGQCRIGRDLDQPLRPDTGCDFLTFLPGTLIAPYNGRPDYLIIFIQHDQSMHLP